MAQKSIVFVDDEPQVLHGMERTLRPMRHEWRMSFCTSGEAALARLDEGPCDVIVTDMRMPGMDGAALLRLVAERHPAALRLVLSGQADEELLVRASGCAHQLLSKPFDALDLKARLEQMLERRTLLADEHLCALVARLGTLPSLPTLYTNIVSELSSHYPSSDRVGAIVARDVSMTAKLLQLVNSPMFGVQRTITDPAQAVRLLGLERLRTLALSAHVFASFGGRRRGGVDAGALWEHSLAVSERARAIAAAERLSADAIAETLSGGMLHDIGKLVLAEGLGREYDALIGESERSGAPLWHVEQQALGTTHAHVGAYLLGIWGLPEGLVTCVGSHHAPTWITALSPAAIVAIANALVVGSNTLPDAWDAWLGANGVPDWRARWTSAPAA